ncbi:hypothetical protein PENTCL1PPCAC_28307, partial [Pristionchus entomophagus]
LSTTRDDRSLPLPNSISTQSASARKYDRRNLSTAPPRKPRRTFKEVNFGSNNDLNKSKSENTISISNDDLSHRIVNLVRNRTCWMDVDSGLSLFANPFDDLSGERCTLN